MQQYLNNIASVDQNITPVNVTGTFDEATRNAVLQYQKEYGLSENGIVDRTTWNSIGGTYLDVISGENPQPTQYPGYALSVGQRDKNAQ